MESQDIKNLNKEVEKLKKEVAILKGLMKEDLEFIRRTEEAWQEHERGKFVSMPADKFLEELDKC